MGLKLITPPQQEPVRIEEAKMHLRIDGNEEDIYIESIISAAREYCENFQNCVYMYQIWELSFDSFPDVPLLLPKTPVIEVINTKVKDINGQIITINPENFTLDSDSEPQRLLFSPGSTWPDVVLYPVSAVRIQFACGLQSSDNVPERVKLAIKMLIGHWYEHREAVGENLREIPMAVDRLLWQDRRVPV